MLGDQIYGMFSSVPNDPHMHTYIDRLIVFQILIQKLLTNEIRLRKIKKSKRIRDKQINRQTIS